MNLFGWIGIFFLAGAVLFLGAALSMSRGKRITRLNARVVSIREPDTETPSAGKKSTENEEETGVTEYEFLLDGETVRAWSSTMTSRAVGESETVYRDSLTGAICHPRTVLYQYIAACGFAAGGILILIFQNALL